MSTSKFCEHCGNKLDGNDLFCPKCGVKVGASSIQSSESASLESVKSGKIALLLCLFLGMLGAHRFYVGKIGTGILTLVTAGFLGVWVVIDLILIVRNKFEDKNGRPLELTQNITPVKETLLIAGTVMVWFALFIASIAALFMYTTSNMVTVVDDQLTALQNDQIERAYSYTSKDFQQIISIDGFRKYVHGLPALINNSSAHFTDRKIVGNNGYLAGTITTKDGTKTPVIFQLIRENGQWKILNIKVMNQPSSSP